MKSIMTESGNEFAINDAGEGLFFWEKQQGIWAQLAGTAQFSATTPKALITKLNRISNDNGQPHKMKRLSAKGWEAKKAMPIKSVADEYLENRAMLYETIRVPFDSGFRYRVKSKSGVAEFDTRALAEEFAERAALLKM